MFSQASSDYLQYCDDHDYAQGTIERKAQIIRYFISFIGHDPAFDDVGENEIESYLASLPKKKTANRHLREIKTLYNWLIKKKYCRENPCVSIEKYRTQQFTRYVPPPEDINKVLLQASDFEFDFLQAIYHLSARRKEIMALRWSDVDFENKMVAIWTRKRYGGVLERDLMKMNNVLFEILERRYKNKSSEWVFPAEDGGQLVRTKVEKMLPRLCKKAGVKPFGFHAIRHHVSALMAASKKLSLIEIQQQLRHKNATTTDHYLRSLVNESNAANVLEEMQSDAKLVPFKKKKG